MHHALVQMMMQYAFFQPFAKTYIVDRYFFPIAPAWAQAETFAFQLVGLETATSRRVFPPAEFFPPGFDLQDSHAINLFFMVAMIIIRLLRFHSCRSRSWTMAFADRKLRPLYDRSLGLWLVVLVLRGWFERAIIVAAIIQGMRDGQVWPVIWRMTLLMIFT
ncbi:hypothetical protein PG997_001463 [Apiospora hydei]|uniref:Uncharacterized protein n=1 Tax=Apiospora hydei TaxID=1337664 RepID=A0ABR1XDN0_9PEZI